MPVLREVLPKYKPASTALPLHEEVRAGLVLGEAAFQGEGSKRTIVGTVHNESSQRADSVVVTLNLHVDSDSVVAQAVGKIPSIEPHGVAHFRTDPVPLAVQRFLVRDIVGTQQ